MNKSKKGFTLIELIVVLAILAVIMAIAVPTAFGSIESARQSADRGSIDGFNSTIRMRSGFIAADPNMDKDLEAAIVSAGISKTTAAQSNLVVAWVPAKDAACGYFDVAPTSGTALVKGKSLYMQLVDIAGGGTASADQAAAETKAKTVMIMK